jgi:hypothetical protein
MMPVCVCVYLCTSDHVSPSLLTLTETYVALFFFCFFWCVDVCESDWFVYVCMCVCLCVCVCVCVYLCVSVHVWSWMLKRHEPPQHSHTCNRNIRIYAFCAESQHPQCYVSLQQHTCIHIPSLSNIHIYHIHLHTHIHIHLHTTHTHTHHTHKNTHHSPASLLP